MFTVTNFKKLIIGCCVLCACSINNAVLADGMPNSMIFEPIDIGSMQPYTQPSYSKPPSSAISNATFEKSAAVSQNATKEDNMLQNALLQIDNAQVEIRNNLLEAKTKYSEIDKNYKLVKNERAVTKKHVRSLEKRIKDLDSSKKTIRKNML